MRVFILVAILLILTIYMNSGQSDHLYNQTLNSSDLQSFYSGNSLRVLTYNIRYGKGVDGKQDLERIARVILETQADLIALQEVERFSIRSQFVDQTRYLAEELDMYAIYGPAFSIGPYRYGNAILSRYPIESWEIIPVPYRGEPRNFIKAKISIDQSQITFICTHFGLNHEERINHVKRILKEVGDMKEPLIIAGDFNSIPESKEITMMTEVLQDAYQGMKKGDGLTFPSPNPKYRIDYIFTSFAIEIEKSYVIKSMASDHLPFVANLRIPIFEPSREINNLSGDF